MRLRARRWWWIKWQAHKTGVSLTRSLRKVPCKVKREITSYLRLGQSSFLEFWLLSEARRTGNSGSERHSQNSGEKLSWVLALPRDTAQNAFFDPWVEPDRCSSNALFIEFIHQILIKWILCHNMVQCKDSRAKLPGVNSSLLQLTGRVLVICFCSWVSVLFSIKWG
jgi:hypothetical protein